MTADKISIEEGDLLLSSDPEAFRCHQCNCVSLKAAGLAFQIFKRYPQTNTYQHHKSKPSTPGTADVFMEERIVNLYAQYQPGKAPSERKKRLTWFQSALLDMLEKVPPRSSFAFPFLIGCGLAGGDWSEYYKILCGFSQHDNVRHVTIYKLS